MTETKKERLKKFQEDLDSFGFSKISLGHEIFVESDDNGHIHVRAKVQTSMDEFQIVRMHFTSQSQMERLFPTILKGLKL